MALSKRQVAELAGGKLRELMDDDLVSSFFAYFVTRLKRASEAGDTETVAELTAQTALLRAALNFSYSALPAGSDAIVEALEQVALGALYGDDSGTQPS